MVEEQNNNSDYCIVIGLNKCVTVINWLRCFAINYYCNWYFINVRRSIERCWLPISVRNWKQKTRYYVLFTTQDFILLLHYMNESLNMFVGNYTFAKWVHRSHAPVSHHYNEYQLEHNCSMTLVFFLHSLVV